LAKKALDAARSMAHLIGVASALRVLGNANFILANYDVAIGHLIEGLAEARVVQNPVIEASCLNSLGNCHHRLGDLPLALEHYEKFMDVMQHLGDVRGQAVALTNIGLIYQELQDPDNALRCQLEAFEKMASCGEAYVTAKLNEGVIYNSLKRFEEALVSYQMALGFARAQNNRFDEIRLLCNIAESRSELGQLELAFTDLQTALDLVRSIGAPHQEVHTLLTLGAVWRKAGNLPLAQQYMTEALSLAERIGQKRFMVIAHQALAAILEAQARPQEALEHFRRFTQLDAELYRSLSEQRSRALLARLELEKARFEGEVHRLRNVELLRSNIELEQTNTALRNTLQAIGFDRIKGAAFAGDWDSRCPLSLTLGISNATSRFHVSSILSKLGVDNRTQAVAIGLQQGWIRSASIGNQ
jgi:diguanylate cyclase